MKLDKQAQEAVRNLGAAVNSAIEKSPDVARAIDAVRRLGYEPHLTLKLEIALQQIGANKARDENYEDFSADDESEEVDLEEADLNEEIELELTDEDVRTLRRMKIRFE